MDLFLISPWPYLVTAALAALTGIYVWTRPHRPGTRYFGSLAGLLLVWSLAAVLYVMAPSYLGRFGAFALASVVSQAEPVLHLKIALEYTGSEKWLARRALNLLFLPAFLMALMFIFQPQWVSMVEVHSGIQVILGHAPVKQIYTLFSYLMVLIALGVLLNCLLRAPAFRVPLLLLSLGRIVPALAYFAFDPRRILVSPILATVLFLGITVLLYLVALYSFRILQVIPVARDAVIAHLPYSLLVLDAENRLVDFNAAAKALPGLPGKMAIQQPGPRALGAWWERLAPLVGPERTAGDVPVTTEAGKRIYHVASLPLTQATGRRIGQAMLIEDVTEERRAQLKQIQAELRESEAIQNLIFDNASDGIAIYEEYPEAGGRRLLECNARYAEMSGRSKEELLEIGETRRVQKPLGAAPYATTRSGLADAQSEGLFSWIRPDGKENIIEYRAETIRLGGRLLSIGLDRDVTERVKAEEQINSQQQALAMLHEREQLARELHDSLGQVLGYTTLRMEATRKLVADGKLATADEHLLQMEQIVSEAHADVREYILNLRTAPTGQQPFFTALRQYLDGFLKNYGIRADLSIGNGVDERLFPPETQMQLFRIIQEAFSNARKHAQAGCIQVSFDRMDSYVRVRIRDDGRGFDPQQAAPDGSSHFGLRIMRERAEQIGGMLRVDSTPGEGTCVEVEIPEGKE
jgi:PAS domain S-box-containing protein